jgi:hypothetical protein
MNASQAINPPAFDDRLGALDLSLMESVESESTDADKQSLLALQHAIRERHGTFEYLEIGSHLGGSLQGFVADPRCTRIVSIDPRPLHQPDERWPDGAPYPDNSTQRMLELLARVPGADLTKLHTIEASTEHLGRADVAGTPQLCFIDGEHTVAAALRDAEFCRAVMDPTGVIAFHDRVVVAEGIRTYLRRHGGIAYALRGNILVVEPRGVACPLFDSTALRSRISLRPLWQLAQRSGTTGRLIGTEGRAGLFLDRHDVRAKAARALGRG